MRGSIVRMRVRMRRAHAAAAMPWRTHAWRSTHAWPRRRGWGHSTRRIVSLHVCHSRRTYASWSRRRRRDLSWRKKAWWWWRDGPGQQCHGPTAHTPRRRRRDGAGRQRHHTSVHVERSLDMDRSCALGARSFSIGAGGCVCRCFLFALFRTGCLRNALLALLFLLLAPFALHQRLVQLLELCLASR